MNQNEIYAINHSLINEKVINIYLLYTSYIYIYLLYILHEHYKQKWIKPYERQNFLRGNPVTGKKTTEASLSSKITLPVSTLAGATTPYNYFTSLLLEWATTLIYNDFPAPTGRGYNPYKPTV